MRTELDHPLWYALVGAQSPFAQGPGGARRFKPEVSNLAALAPGAAPDAWGELTDTLAPGEHVALFFFDEAPPLPADCPLRVVYEGDYEQMVCTALGSATNSATAFVELGSADVDQMLALVALTQPGPFCRRTPELGRYLGVRHRGELVAMAGQRAQLPGFREVSAVCTHPDHRGRGLADMLVRALVSASLAQGDAAFLHVRLDNDTARRAYERIGFVTRRAMRVMAVQRRRHSV